MSQALQGRDTDLLSSAWACFWDSQFPIRTPMDFALFTRWMPAASRLPATAIPDSQLAWTPDGRAVSFINHISGAGNIWNQPVAGGPPKPVTHFAADRIFAFAWLNDGQLAISRGTEPVDAVLIKGFR